MSYRLAQINKLIHHELSRVFLEVVGKTSGFVTITEVDTSKDLSYAKIWVTIHSNEKETIQLLKNKMYKIQGALNKRLHLKKIPRIRIELDNTGEQVDKLTKLLTDDF